LFGAGVLGVGVTASFSQEMRLAEAINTAIKIIFFIGYKYGPKYVIYAGQINTR
jgi:hypothetical protein